jgi:hypothetical protein
MTNNNDEPKFFRTVFADLGQFFNDLFSGEFFKKIKTDLEDIRQYFLDKNRKKRLEQMGLFRRFFYSTAWLFKILVFRLSSFRRLLLILALILIFTMNTDTGGIGGKTILGIMMLIFIILLELKDKLFAREELEAGRAIQEALVPETCPSVPGWDVWLFTRPANDVGGDLVDFLKISDNRYGIGIGDVAGKGLPAALLMAKLQATLRALTPDISSLSQLAHKINTIFNRDSLPNRFASLLYLEINLKNPVIRFVNAGHFPPLLLRGQNIREMKKGAPALGIMSDTSFTEESIEISNNEFFIVYSDGVTEARNEEGDFFGEGGLRAVLAELEGMTGEEAGNKILENVDSFIGSARANDDLSLVVVRRTDP